METNRVKQIHEFGQSIWLDFIDRQLLNSGGLQKLIDEDGIRGITSNPAIFEKAISGSTDYDADIKQLTQAGHSDEDIFYGLAVADIQRAADLFQSVFEDKVSGADGYVSLEVAPQLARDTEGTIRQARELWQQVDRHNVMIKIPGTEEGLPAIQQAISEGININVTLLFGLDRYEAVTEAYIAGLEERLRQGQPVESLASVASFFLSRIDVLVDPLLEQKGLGNLQGETAVALAKEAYQIYTRVFGSERFQKLAAQGATPQRLLWASTGSKNPAFSDIKYVEALIGPKTVNTVPLDTLEAYRDHGQPQSRLQDNPEGAAQVLQQVQAVGIDLGAVAQQLEDEGIEKFNKPYAKLLQAIREQKQVTLAAQG